MWLHTRKRMQRSDFDDAAAYRKKGEFGRDIYFSFIDFSQAYDSVWREGMWELLGKYGVDQKLISILKNYMKTLWHLFELRARTQKRLT